MSDLRKEALQALEDGEIYDHFGARWGEKRIEALRAALAQPEPCADEFDCDHMPWCRIRKTCQKQARAALAHQDRTARRTVTYVCPVCAASLERQE